MADIDITTTTGGEEEVGGVPAESLTPAFSLVPKWLQKVITKLTLVFAKVAFKLSIKAMF